MSEDESRPPIPERPLLRGEKDPENARAVRSYEKVGFRREGVMRRSFRVKGELTDSLLMAILRDEWQPVTEPE